MQVFGDIFDWQQFILVDKGLLLNVFYYKRTTFMFSAVNWMKFRKKSMHFLSDFENKVCNSAKARSSCSRWVAKESFYSTEYKF